MVPHLPPSLLPAVSLFLPAIGLRDGRHQGRPLRVPGMLLLVKDSDRWDKFCTSGSLLAPLQSTLLIPLLQSRGCRKESGGGGGRHYSASQFWGWTHTSMHLLKPRELYCMKMEAGRQPGMMGGPKRKSNCKKEPNYITVSSIGMQKTEGRKELAEVNGKT